MRKRVFALVVFLALGLGLYFLPSPGPEIGGTFVIGATMGLVLSFNQWFLYEWLPGRSRRGRL